MILQINLLPAIKIMASFITITYFSKWLLLYKYIFVYCWQVLRVCIQYATKPSVSQKGRKYTLMQIPKTDYLCKITRKLPQYWEFDIFAGVTSSRIKIMQCIYLTSWCGTRRYTYVARRTSLSWLRASILVRHVTVRLRS